MKKLLIAGLALAGSLMTATAAEKAVLVYGDTLVRKGGASCMVKALADASAAANGALRSADWVNCMVVAAEALVDLGKYE